MKQEAFKRIEVDKYVKTMKNIYSSILKFIEEEDLSGSNYSSLQKVFDDSNIRKEKYILKLTLRLLSSISNNHQRVPNFFPKIFQILKEFEKQIKTNFSNQSIFNIFKGNKRILLFLIEEQILFLNKTIINVFQTPKYTNLFG